MADLETARESGGLYIRQILSEEQQHLEALQEQLESEDNLRNMGRGEFAPKSLQKVE